MEMDEEFLESNDLDWFSAYQDGYIAHFATGGKGIVPESVKSSTENYEVIYDYFYAFDKTSEIEIVGDNLPSFSNEAQRNRYLKSFIDMAERGLFSHDVKDDGTYKLIARPNKGISYSNLPDVIKNILHVLPDNVLSSDAEITTLE
ncbi:hypothetical protein EO763_04225 [Pectobacterium odoriferum]|uniref:hypothetical protein n=1 Tax=Pectobacterium odoriferum TaxID=78398 RepID=UPI001374089C|nr:hypothetical protein [Pectobacterium odoriferum]QHP79219.1 hypothetical protein EO763_04225 [Pectobacterium odoriferum]